jgi:hypothetical protein
MKLSHSIFPILGLALAGAAHAGSTGAGPIGSAASASGSIVTPGSPTMLNGPSKDERNERIVPGSGGSVRLSAEQVAQTAEVLRRFEGASVSGAVIKAPTVLADGTVAVIALNTETGELLVTRRQK